MLDRYNEIWDKIKPKLKIKFHSTPVYDEKCIKSKVRKLDDVSKKNFLGNKIPNENKPYTCIACIAIDSVMRMEKRNYPQVYLEECKKKMKKTNISKFIPKSESESESEFIFLLYSNICTTFKCTKFAITR